MGCPGSWWPVKLSPLLDAAVIEGNPGGRWCSLMSPQQPRCAAVPRFGEVMGEVVQNSRFAQPRGFMRNVLAGACGLGTGRSGGDECTFGLTSPCSLFFWVQTEDLWDLPEQGATGLGGKSDAIPTKKRGNGLGIRWGGGSHQLPGKGDLGAGALCFHNDGAKRRVSPFLLFTQTSHPSEVSVHQSA